MKGFLKIDKEIEHVFENQENLQSLFKEFNFHGTCVILGKEQLSISPSNNFEVVVKMEFLQENRSYLVDVYVHKDYPYKGHRVGFTNIHQYLDASRLWSLGISKTGAVLSDDFHSMWSPAYNLSWLIKYILTLILFEF